MQLPYSLPPYSYAGNRMLVVTFRTEPEFLGRLVPDGLVPNSDSLINAFVGDLRIVAPMDISYYEAGYFFAASFGRREGFYVPALYLDRSMPITIGREIWGYPKISADDFSLTEEGGRLQTKVVKDGLTLIEASMRLGTARPRKTIHAEDFVLKLIPTVTGDANFAVKQLAAVPVIQTLNESYTVEEISMRLGELSKGQPDAIPVLEIVGGLYAADCALELNSGEVLHDYLA
ncbi:MAG TPA: hypothetical protein DDY14_06395 [Chromatiaceae bacterium]|jgi:acetoacetate decarboxylase|nr:MAG: hypothetical protein N838_09330 [Thiohalocapsa sp. PB-PSB1]QQO56005.1 MAG: acetoacetate decarboxylase family protein [Thiohalocapsa sp. PB-PSB1]HBG94948.1 hypothetical protein [Chromatiaceae bacterium]HCS90025.1 hypothetical protein [Chromatiaceae bacterium]